MTTYLVHHLGVPGLPKDEDLEYLEEVEAPFLPYGGRWLVLDGQVDVLEGAWPGSVVLMEFPDRETARRWCASPEYRDIVGLRTANAISDLVLVDPVDPGFITSAAWAAQIRAAITAGSAADGRGGDTSEEQP